MSMQVLDGDPIERRYLDGGTVWRLPVALVLRQAADDTAERLDAQEILRSLCAAVRSLADPSAGYLPRPRAGALCARSRPGRCPRGCRRRRNHRLPGDAGGQIQDAAIGRRLVHGERRRRGGYELENYINIGTPEAPEMGQGDRAAQLGAVRRVEDLRAGMDRPEDPPTLTYGRSCSINMEKDTVRDGEPDEWIFKHRNDLDVPCEIAKVWLHLEA